MKPKRIPIEEIKSFYEYRDGDLIKKATGKAVGWRTRNGYLMFDFKREKYLVHRVIFALHFGDTEHLIDHINRDKQDNRIDNLRESNKSLNGLNKGLRVDNKSGVTGVTYCKSTGKYEVRFKGEWFGRHSFETAVKIRQSLEEEEDYVVTSP